MTANELLERPAAVAAAFLNERLRRGAAGSRTLVVAAERRSRDALRRDLEAAGIERGSVVLRTVAGLASSLLDAEGERFRSGRLLGPFASRVLAGAALEATPTPSYPRAAREAPRFRDDVARLLSELTALDETARAGLAANPTPHLNDLLAIDARYRAALASAGAFDLGSIVARATRALERDGRARAFARSSFDVVLLFGIEDYDVASLACAAELCKHVSAAFAIEEPAAALSDAPDREAGRALLQRLRERARTISIPPRFGAASAIAETIKARAPADEADAIARHIEESLVRGIAPDRIGIVLRDAEPYGAVLLRELRARGIPHGSVPREEARDDASLAFVRAAFALFARPDDAARWAHVLGAPAAGSDSIRVRLELAREAPGTFAATLERVLEAGAPPGETARADTRAALLAAHDAWEAGDVTRCARTLVRELALPAALREASTAPRDVADARAAAAVARLRALVDAVADVRIALEAAGANASCEAVVRAFDAGEASLAAGLASESHGAGVRLLDVRAAKLADLDLVFVPGAAEGRFPREAASSPLFSPDDRAALARAGVDLAIAREGADDPRERRSWYVAAERGRARTIASYAVADVEGRPARPSRAIPSALLPPADAAPYARPYEIPAGANAGRATAAHPLLATLLDARAAETFERTAPRALRREAPLPVGAIDRWLRCPRLFYFEKIARIEEDETIRMRIGTVLHRVLEAFHREECDFRSVRDTDVARWTTLLHALLERHEGALDHEPATLRANGTYVLRRMLADYARALHDEARDRPFTVEACEKEIEIALGGARLRGRIDRLDRLAGGALAIRDYKAGVQRAALGKGLDKVVETIELGERPEGAAPSYFSAQLALYRLAELDATRLQLIYFGGKDEKRDRISEDVVEVDGARATQIATLAQYVREQLLEPLAAGSLTHFPTTRDEQICRFCSHRRICTGAGSIA